MKKLLAMLSCILVLGISAFPVSAVDISEVKSALSYQSLTNADEYSEISDLSDEIVRYVNNFSSFHSLPREITEKDIDFSKADKLYSVMDRSGLKTTSSKELLNNLDNDYYIWQLPIDIDGKIVTVGLSIEHKISKENEHLFSESQLKRNNERAGQWHATSFIPDPTCTDYRAKINKTIASSGIDIEKSDVIFAVGFPPFGTAVAITMSDGNIDKLVPLFKPSKVDTSGAKNLSARDSSIIDEFNSKISDNSVFEYSDILSLLDSLPVDEVKPGELSAGAGITDEAVLIK